MVTSGHIDIALYKHEIKVTVMAHYTNSLGNSGWFCEYFVFKFGSIFWRMKYEKDIIEYIKHIAVNLHLPIRDIHDFHILNSNIEPGSTGIPTTVLLDLHNIK